MFLYNECVDIKISNANKNWYIEKGYLTNDECKEYISVKVSDIFGRPMINVPYKCDRCGNVIFPRYNKVLNKLEKDGEYLCSSCGTQKYRDDTLKARANEMFEKMEIIAEQKGYTIISNVEDYTGVYDRIKYMCPQHGIQEMSIHNFMKGRGCPVCGKETTKSKEKLSNDIVEQRINMYNGNKLLNKEDYVNSTTNNLQVLCACGEVFTTSLSHYNEYRRCKKCNAILSNGELKIANFLNSHNIKFVSEKKFDDCIDKKCLPFDFYIESLNTVIEFDGAQHYAPHFGKEQFETTKRHDEIKNNYCNTNNIKLIRIPYWEEDNIEDILISKLAINDRLQKHYIKIRLPNAIN